MRTTGEQSRRNRDPASALRSPLDLVALTPLMAETSGRPEIAIGLVDGPVARDHADLVAGNVREVGSGAAAACARADSIACQHGTFVAGILCARRGSAAPAIAPDCTLLVRPIFREHLAMDESVPSASPEQLAAAIVECVHAGARLINVSAALTAIPNAKGERALRDALDHAAHRGVIVVAAAGNQGWVGSSAITRHAWVIAVAGCTRDGEPLALSNLGRTIGRWGLCAPAENITSLSADGATVTAGGTSVAAPFVTGAIALVWSRFPDARAGQLRLAVTRAHPQRRGTVVPARLNAMAIDAAMATRVT
jgi:subtilisin family serine protease